MVHVKLILVLLSGLVGTSYEAELNRTGKHPSKRLLDELYEKKLHKGLRPVLNSSDTLTIRLSIGLRQITNVDATKQTLNSLVWMRQYWTDPYMTWNPAEHNGTKTIFFPSSDLWMPDLYLYNSVDKTVRPMYDNHILVLNCDGLVTNMYPLLLESACTLRIDHFPFDEQVCRLTFGSWAYDGFRLDLIPREHNAADYNSYEYNSEWGLVNMTSERNVVKYGCCPEPYVDVTFLFRLRRRWTMHFFYLVLPNIFINLMGFLQFMLPPDTNERISFGITIFLTMNVYLILMEDILPTTEHVPWFAQYIGATLVLIGVGELITIVILRIHYQSSHDNHAQLPQWARDFFLHRMSRWLGMNSYITSDEEHLSKMNVYKSCVTINLEEYEQEDSDEETEIDPKDRMSVQHKVTHTDSKISNKESLFANRETFGLSPKDSSVHPHKESSFHPRRDSSVHPHRDSWVPRRESMASRRGSYMTSVRGSIIPLSVDVLLAKILSLLESFKSTETVERKEVELRCEWQELAMILDRFLLYSYTIITLVTMTYFFSVIPTYEDPIIR